MDILSEFLASTGFALMTWGNFLMICIGITFISLGIIKHYEPLLLVPIGMGVIVGNIPVMTNMALTVYDSATVVMENVFVDDNQAQPGSGGLLNIGSGSVTGTKLTFRDGRATG